MSEENVDLVRAFFSAYNLRDADACDRLFDAHAEVITVSTRGGLPGVNWGRGESSRYFEALDEAWADLRIEIEDYRDLDDTVLAVGCIRGTGRSSRIQLEEPFAVLFVIRDSVFVRVDSYSDPTKALQAAGLSE
jgi:ketosteroid isomerase-like protein